METSSQRHGRSRRLQGNPWTGTAFLIEALLLLLLLLGTLAVFVSLLSRAITTSNAQERLDRAMVVASNSAEGFCASPASYAHSSRQDDLDVTCDVTPTDLGAGVLYQATITVSDGDEVLYTLDCARYVGGDAR